MFFKVEAKIYIYHHNFLAWDWESKFDYQVTRLLSDGLYDKCECVNFCVIWEKAEDLSHFKHKISAQSKFNLYLPVLGSLVAFGYKNDTLSSSNNLKYLNFN